MSVGSPGHVYIKKQDIVVIKAPMGPGLEICISKQSSHQEPAVHVFKPCDTISPCVITCTQHTYSTCIYLGLHLPLFFAWLMHYGSTAGNEHCPYIYICIGSTGTIYRYIYIWLYIITYIYICLGSTGTYGNYHVFYMEDWLSWTFSPHHADKQAKQPCTTSTSSLEEDFWQHCETYVITFVCVYGFWSFQPASVL